MLLTRRNRQRKAAKQNEEEMSSKEQDSTSSHDSESSSSLSSERNYGNESNNEPTLINTAGYTDENWPYQPISNVARTANVPAAEIEKRMRIPFKSLKFAFELGSGNFGKVFKGYVVANQAIRYEI